MATNRMPSFDPNRTAKCLVDRGALLRDSVADKDTSALDCCCRGPYPVPVAVLAVSNPTRQSRIDALLTQLNFAVEEVKSATQVVEHVSKQRQYIVVTDSVELARLLSAHGPVHLRHVVLLVAGDCQEAEGNSAGATDCISLESPNECLRARLTAVRRIQELEASLQAAVVRDREH